MLHAAHKLWVDSIDAVKDVDGITYVLCLQPLPAIITRRSAESGGNMLGLEDAPSLMNVLVVVIYADAQRDQQIKDVTRGLLGSIDVKAKSLGCFHPYKYLNYATTGQTVIEGYGSENVHFMRRVSDKYDPQGFFQKSVPGGFKLPAVQTGHEASG